MIEAAAANASALAQSSASTASGSGKALSKLSADFDFFIKMLTTQLQHQDPMEPQDPSKFTEQLVQYSNVEQQIAQNTKLDELIALQGSGGVRSLLGYLNNEIEVTSDKVSLQDGNARFAYALAENAVDAKIVITSSSGAIVRTMDVDPTAGRHEMAWDGKNDSGSQLQSGTYKITVVAADSEGNPVNNETYFIGRVTGVATSGDGKSILQSGTLNFDASTVNAVRVPTVGSA